MISQAAMAERGERMQHRLEGVDAGLRRATRATASKRDRESQDEARILTTAKVYRRAQTRVFSVC